MPRESDGALLRRAIRNARPQHGDGPKPRWAVVRDLLAVGSATAQHLCTEAGVDPNEEVGHDIEAWSDCPACGQVVADV